jgi:hypothetical protein
MNITRADLGRMDRNGSTGIYVRAIVDGKPQSVDIACLDADSLLGWLRSRGGNNAWAEHVVLMLLGHRPLP